MLLCSVLIPACSVWDAIEPDPCVEHYVMCMDTRLGSTYDGPNKTRCHSCLEACQKNGNRWPRRTPSGRDCQYWNYPWPAVAPDGGEAHEPD